MASFFSRWDETWINYALPTLWQPALAIRNCLDYCEARAEAGCCVPVRAPDARTIMADSTAGAFVTDGRSAVRACSELWK